MGTVKVERSVSIARPPGDVFSFVSDIRNDPKWHTDVLEAKASTEAVGAGTVFDVKIKPSMGVSGGTMTVAEFDPPRRLVFQGRMGKMEPRVSYAVEPEGSGTRYTRVVEIPTKGIMGLMTPMMKRMIGKANDGFLANLKRVLEA